MPSQLFVLLMKSGLPPRSHRDWHGISTWHGVCSKGLRSRRGPEVVDAETRGREHSMEKSTPTPPDQRNLLTGSVTIGAMLLVSGSAKVGHGVRALVIVALACMLYRAGKYLVIHIGTFLRSGPVESFPRLGSARSRDGATASSTAPLKARASGTVVARPPHQGETVILPHCGPAHAFSAALPPNIDSRGCFRVGEAMPAPSREEIMADARYYVVRDHGGWVIKFEDEHYGRTRAMTTRYASRSMAPASSVIRVNLRTSA